MRVRFVTIKAWRQYNFEVDLPLFLTFSFLPSALLLPGGVTDDATHEEVGVVIGEGCGWPWTQLLLLEQLDDPECACAIIASMIAYNARRDTGRLRMVGRGVVEEPSRC